MGHHGRKELRSQWSKCSLSATATSAAAPWRSICSETWCGGRGSQFQIASAATSREEIGNDVYPPARAELRAHGIPVGHRAAVQVTPRDYDAYDWLLTMDENNARNLRRILPHDPDGKIRALLSFAGLQRGIADPWYTDDFGTTYDDLVLGCTAFLDALRRRGDI